MMQAKYYALTAMVTALVAMGAQAQTYTPSTSEVQSSPLPGTQPSAATEPSTQPGIAAEPSTQPSIAPASGAIIVAPEPGTITIVEKAPPGVGAPAVREEVRAETLDAMKEGTVPKGELEPMPK
jgi:hypothetical protein